MRRTWCYLAVLMLVPLAAGDDPDPPVLVQVDVGPAIVPAGGTVTVSMEWYDASGMAQVWAVAWGPNDLMVTSDCAVPHTGSTLHMDCPIDLPERAPAGEWSIRQISGKDMVGHTTTEHGPLPFTVDSPYDDVEPPELIAVEAHLTRHEINTSEPYFHVPDAFTVHAADASPVQQGGLTFIGPGGNQGLWAQCQDPDGGALRCDLHGNANIPGGTYRLDSVGLTDAIGYHGWYSDDEGNPRARPLTERIGAIPEVVIVGGDDDQAPPVLVAFALPDQVYRGESFTMYINGTDASGLESAWLGFRTTRGNALVQRHVQDQEPTYEDQLPCTGTWQGDVRLECTMMFPVNFPLGIARLEFIGLSDPGHNEQRYSPQHNGYLHYERIPDDDHNDTAIKIMPRPLDGVITALDAIVNEVDAGETMQWVYQSTEPLDELIVELTDEAGQIISVPCSAGDQTAVGTLCDVVAPAGVGVYNMTSIQAVAGSGATIRQFPDAPIIAVEMSMPLDAYADLAPGQGRYGAGNSVGADAQEKVQYTGPSTSESDPSSPPSVEPAAPESGPITKVEPADLRPAPLPPESPEASPSIPGVGIAYLAASLVALMLWLRRR